MGKGGRKQLQCKFARLDEGNLSSPMIIIMPIVATLYLSTDERGEVDLI